MGRLPLLPLLLALPAAADDDRVPPATPVGEAVDCLPVPQIRRTLVRSDLMIDVVGPGRRVWRNTLPRACPGLGLEQRFAYETSTGQLCSVDVITVLYTTGPYRGATCALGRFQPVRLARGAR